VIRNRLPDPDSDADHHQNVIGWSLGHTPALHKISSKSIGNFFDNPVNLNFGLRTPGSGQWSGSSPKFNHLVPGPCPTPPRNFIKIRSQLFQLTVGSNKVKIWVGGKLGKEWWDFDSQRTRSYFLGSRLRCKVSSKSSENCDRRRVDRQTNRSENITSFFGGGNKSHNGTEPVVGTSMQ